MSSVLAKKKFSNFSFHSVQLAFDAAKIGSHI